MPEYSQGICQDGAAILRDGKMLTVEEILEKLRKAEAIEEFMQASGDNTQVEISNEIKDIANYLAHYWGTYSHQGGVSTYMQKTILDDLLYGVGAAINRKYSFAQGYDRFKEDLLKHLISERENGKD